MRIIQFWLTLVPLITILRTANADCTSQLSSSLCDPRCNGQCTVQYDQNYCCDCVLTYLGINHYFWNRAVIGVTPARCGPTCPTGFYPDIYKVATYGYYQCTACDYRCQTCTNSTNSDCVTCTIYSYQQDSTTCQQETNTDNTNNMYPYVANPCIPPYYGVYTTMTCKLCPTGCLQCSIYLPYEMPSPYTNTTYQWNTPCAGNGLCEYALRCYICNSSANYVLEEGQCITTSRCRKYSIYNTTSTVFSPSFCQCKTYFYLSGVTSCSTCHWACKTCNGASSAANCITCHTGTNKNGSLCSPNNTYLYIVTWNGAMPANNASDTYTATMTGAGGSPVSASNTNCDSGNYVFGYYGYDGNYNSLFGTASLKYVTTNTVLGTKHYGVHFRAKFLFIDDWVNNMIVTFEENGIMVYQYKYYMQFIIGEYLCGRAPHDHHEIIDFTFPHNRTNNIDLTISVPYSGFQWGIRDVVVGLLLCDTSCNSCKGPTQFDCLTCGSNQVVVNGDCVCDISAGYYNDSNNGYTCRLTCANNWYMNPYTRTCTSSCPNGTYLFQYVNSTSGKRYCVEDCPAGMWKYTNNMSCVSDCYDPAIADASNWYNFDGLDKVCYNVCPNGYYGDPTSHYCVTKCPSLYYVRGNVCALYCSSTTYAYSPTGFCMSTCPTGYYKNILTISNGSKYNICEDECSVTLGGTHLLGDNTTNSCVDYCPSGGGFADFTRHLCMGVCNSTSLQQVVNNSGQIQRTCQLLCDSATYSIYGNWQTGACVEPSKCPANQYGDPLTTFCESNCTDPLHFGDNFTHICQTFCNNSGFKQNYTKTCVKTCPASNYNGDPQFGDHLIQNSYCVLSCLSNTYADEQYNRECVYSCKSSPVSSWGENNVCVYNCSDTRWGDVNKNRTCTTSCTWSSGGIKSYGQNQTRLCVTNCPDTTFGAILLLGSVPMCIYICEVHATGQFGLQSTNLCVDKCPSPYYGDQSGNRTCVLECPDGWFAQNTTAAGAPSDIRICVQTCDYGWADNVTRKCATSSAGCTNGTYAHESNHKCVFPGDCTGFADPVSMHCLPTCQFNSSVTYYGDPSTKTCVLICPSVPNYFGDNYTHQCVSSCSMNTIEVRDFQYMRRCVPACSRTPIALFFDLAAGNCVAVGNCTAGTYADNFTNHCESDCKGVNDYYADPVTGACVKQCELGWYGHNESTNVGRCVQQCPLDEWADNFTVLCTPKCTDGTFGLNYTNLTANPVYSYGICQKQCPDGQFARDTDNVCVPNCGPDLWGNQQNNTCVHSPYYCPVGQYADNETHMCVNSTDCSLVGGTQYVADNLTNECLPGCPPHYIIANYTNWADMAKKLCVHICPEGYFGYNSTLTCQTQCRDNPTAAWPQEFADPQNRICVSVCSAYPIPTYGETDTHTCVQAIYCPPDTWAEIIVNLRRCVSHCPNKDIPNSIPQNYADNISRTCVTTCPTYFYGDLSSSYGKCVDVCPATTLSELQFSDNLTKTCVTVCPISQNTFGDVLSLRCVLTCPDTYFAQQLPKRHCVLTCGAGSWGNTIRRFCETSRSNCPTINESHYYADDHSHLCVPTCPISQNTWGENSTWGCVPNCLTGFKYNITRVCIDLCPATVDGEGSFSDQGMCYFVCMTPLYYRDPQNNRSCQPSCSFSPVKYYKDTTTMKCVLECPVYPSFYFAYDPNKQCRLDCPSPYMESDITRSCVTSCPNNSFYDPNNNQCTQDCPQSPSGAQQYFGDSTRAIPTCVTAANCPNTYFADSNTGLCTQVCSEKQWKYGKYCVTYCPDGYYGDAASGFCVMPAGCDTGTYAQNYTQECVSSCNGSYADTSIHMCVDICPNGTFGDPITRLCSTTCTNNSTIQLHKNSLNNTCVSGCSEYLYLNTLNNTCDSNCTSPYFADRTTQICVTVCPSSPPLYGHSTSHTCVEECDNISLKFKDQTTRTCVSICPVGYFRNNITMSCVRECFNMTYADSNRGYCVYNCSPQYALDTPVSICTSLCPAPYYRDPTTFRCVLQCATSPVTYYKAVNGADNYCDVNCPTSQYRDKLSFSCVSMCPPSPRTIADGSSGNCVKVCPSVPDYYANLLTRVCVPKCPDGMYAENLTRTCVEKCPAGKDLYSDSNLPIPYCVKLCSSSTYADPYTLQCTSSCSKVPQTYGFQNLTTRLCVTSCPYPYVADNNSYTCVLNCGYASKPYLDKVSQQCVSYCTSKVYKFSYMPLGQTVNGECVSYCPPGFFALLTNNSCVSKCPNGLYGDTMNNTCFASCTLANNHFADSTTNLCVPVCPYSATYDSYGDKYSRKCVTTCPTNKFTVKDPYSRLCEPMCTDLTYYIDYSLMKCVTQCSQTPLMFADPVSRTCVSNCSLYSLRYGYVDNRTCVTQCPTTGLYANDETRICVSATSCQTGTFGLDPQRICIQVCPTDRDYYGDPTTHTCVPTCPTSYYADPSTRLCVSTCPQVPSLYGILPAKKCVPSCTGGLFADNQTRKCTSFCTTTPAIQFADPSTYICVKICPTSPNLFSQNVTFTCTSLCPSASNMFADYSTRKCVKYCPAGKYPTYADTATRQCELNCTNGTFMQNSTGTCVTTCIQGFADPQTKYCIAICPHYTYGLLPQRICVTGCPNATPQVYAEDNTNMCQSSCLLIYNTFKDDTTNRCVKICPISHNLFAQPINRKCVGLCLQTPFQFADFSTRECVTTCPTQPALFGYISTQICVAQCPNNTYSDNVTRTCVTLCPDTPDTYGDNSTWSCVFDCPIWPDYTWADDYSRTCVPLCPAPPDYYADNSTGRCVTLCANGTFADPLSRRCVQTCPDNYFARNSTRRCVPTCPPGQFADSLLHICVQKCSVNPIFYGNPDTHICVQQCPNTTYSFGNPLTQECVKYLTPTLAGKSGCPDYLYSDNSTRLCVPKCPRIQDTYGDNSTWKCVDVCPAGTVNTFSDNYTMMCVSVCPQYPNYYAEPYSRRCVFLCLASTPTYSGSFSDNSTRKCVQTCPQIPDYYSDNSTRRCVFNCPYNPLTFADYSTRRCVSICPPSPDLYGDLKTRRCVLGCPPSESTYADYTIRLCVKVCNQSAHLFGNNISLRCVPYTGCPVGTYADNKTRLCVGVCPQYPDTYGDYSTKRCVFTCPAIPDIYADPINRTCVLRCPDGSYADNITRRCLEDCPTTVVNYADNLTNRCVSLCPASEKTFGDNSTRKCVLQCPDTPFTYADNITQTCLAICINITTSTEKGGYADNSTRRCVQVCPNFSYGDITTRYCVSKCPIGWFASVVNNMCVNRCPVPYFADNSTWTCVIRCPASQLLFGQNIDRTCTPLCPLGTYADSYSQECVAVCPGANYTTFAYEPTRECVQQCPYGLFGYPVNWTCIDQCVDPYYNNITDHRCYKCPEPCAQCTYPENCVICNPNFYLYSGSCLASCPTFPIITYANPSGICGTAFQCPSGYFALNTTKSCVTSCPSGFYKNSTLQACDSCLPGCVLCTNSLQCLTCDSAVSLWDSNTCYIFCSPLLHYYSSEGCVNTCPSGSYLQLVTCMACSSICSSCIVQPQNCLTCANGYYLSSNLCVSQCPNNTKAVLQNSKLYCKSCDLINCATTPLTYTVTQYVQNYEYKFRVHFSQSVNITKQIDQVIRIMQVTQSRRMLLESSLEQQKPTNQQASNHPDINSQLNIEQLQAIQTQQSRRLLQTTYTYLDYTIIDYGNGDYVIVLNNFDARSNSNLQFSFQITDPQAIISPSGQYPQATRTILVIPAHSIYSITDYSADLANYCTFVAVVVVILLLASFWANHSIWMPTIDFFHWLFALLFINMLMPPNPTYALSKSIITIFSFLPNIFANALSSAKYSNAITSTMFTFFGDMIFLRTMGFLYTIVIFLAVVLLVMLALWKKGIWKTVKKYCKNYIKQTFVRRDLHGLVYLFFLPTLTISFMKIRDYNAKTAIEGFSIFSSWLFMIPMIALPIYYAYKIFKLVREYPTTYAMLKKAYEYIGSRQVILQQNPIYYFTNDNNEVDLKQREQPKINQIPILPYPLMTKFHASEVSLPITQYLYKLLIAFSVAVAYNNGSAQLFLLLLFTLLNIIYFAIVKPYIHIHQRQYNNYAVLHNLVAFSLIVIGMIILQLQNNAFTYDHKILLGNIIAGIIIYSITVNMLYFAFRTYHWYYDKIWKPFVFTELFKQNYTLQYWDYTKEYQKLDKQIKGKTGRREQFLNAIKVQGKQDGLQSMVRKDPNQSGISSLDKMNKKPAFKQVNLRPNKTEQLKKQISNMFNTFNNEKQKSHKSLKSSSDRLSKQERGKVRDVIFGDKDLKQAKDQYQAVKIEQRSQQQASEQLSEQATQYEYEYIEEEYPEGTDIQEILKGVKKGQIVLH